MFWHGYEVFLLQSNFSYALSAFDRLFCHLQRNNDRYLLCVISDHLPKGYSRDKDRSISISVVRCVSHTLLYNACVRRDATVLHGIGPGAVPSLRLPHDLEEDLPST